MVVIESVAVGVDGQVGSGQSSFERLDGAARSRWLIRSLVLGALGLLVGYVPVAHAQSDPPACNTSIASCGCSIKKKGTYSVSKNLMASQGLTTKGACIEIKATNATLDLKGFELSSTGNGTGILLLNTANKSTVEGSGGLIDGWDTGVEARSNKVTIHNLDLEDNTVGLFLNKANKCDVSDLTADNGGTGIVMKGVQDGTLSSFRADDNTGGFGVWLRSSNNNDQVTDGEASNNGKTGIFLGCSSSGPTGAKCGVPGTKNTTVARNTADDNGNGGIALDLGNNKNDINNNDASGNSGFDLIDKNPNCDKNNWSGNSFGSANQGCID